MTRTERQLGLVDLFISKINGTIVAPPGFGKTRIGLTVYEKLKRPSTTIVVPSIPLKEQWELITQNLPNIKIIVLKSASKLNISTDFTIFDEFHRVPAVTFKNALLKCSSTYKLGLTASPYRKDGLNKELEKILPIINKISIEECILNEWIMNFKIINLAVNFTETEQLSYNKVQENISLFEDKHLLAWNKAIALVNKDKSTPWTRDRLEALRYIKNVQKRADIIYNSANKLDTTRLLINNVHSDKQIIIFAQSINHIEALAVLLRNDLSEESVAVYHSKISKALRSKALNDFSSKKVRVLVSAEALTEGIDVPECSIAISLSQESSSIKAIQQLGRIIRIGKDTNEVAIFYNLYHKDTQEEKWLQSKYFGLRLEAHIEYY